MQVFLYSYTYKIVSLLCFVVLYLYWSMIMYLIIYIPQYNWANDWLKQFVFRWNEIQAFAPHEMILIENRCDWSFSRTSVFLSITVNCMLWCRIVQSIGDL